MKNKFLAIMLVFILALSFTACGDSSKHEGEAKTPSASSAQKGRDYQDVVDKFKEKGFTNIKTEALEDLVTGWMTKDGEVESVSVDGDEDYSADVWYPNDVPVVITYHTFAKESSDSKEQETESSTQSLEESKNTEETEKSINMNDVKLEAVFPVETAKRAAVVAITNAYATDVFTKDGNNYDVSKFHSYSDVSGDFMKVLSEGTWNSKNETTWHVENLSLKTVPGTIVDANLDVSFDGTNYIVSNVAGTLGNAGASAENKVDISEIEAGKNNPYLTVSPNLVKDERSQAELDARDHSGDLEKNAAERAFEEYGEKMYPYGFECHWIVDLINAEQSSDGSWFFKVGVTIKNEYGTNRKATAEGKVSGTTENCVIDTFYVN
jgi:hypothetical protein